MLRGQVVGPMRQSQVSAVRPATSGYSPLPGRLHERIAMRRDELHGPVLMNWMTCDRAMFLLRNTTSLPSSLLGAKTRRQPVCTLRGSE